MAKWEVGLGDKQFPLADLIYVEVEADTRDQAGAKAKADHCWAFVHTCVPVKAGPAIAAEQVGMEPSPSTAE